MSQFDKDLKPGDLIWAYHKGIHEVIAIERRFHEANSSYGNEGEEYNSLISYKQRFDGAGNPKQGRKEKRCDAAFCVKVTEETIAEKEQELQAQISRWKEIRRAAVAQ